MGRLKRGFIKLFQLVFSLSFILIFGIVLKNPLNNLVPQRMIFYTLFWVVVFGVLWWGTCLLERKIPQLEQKMKYFVPTFLILYGVALYVVSCILRSDILTDYQSVYEAAWQFARGEEVSNWEYFSRWYNNVGCMLFLSVLFFLGSWLPTTVDVYYFVLLFNVIQVVLVVACLYYLIGKMTLRHSIAARLMILIVSAMWIPIWGNTSIFYSDHLSFGTGVFGLTLLVMGWKKHNWYVYMSAAGIVFAVGVILKVTVATIMIALLITVILCSALWKNKEKIAVMIAMFLVVLIGYSLFCKTLPYQQDSDLWKVPTEYWLALGLGENGTFADNIEFGMQCITAEDYESRKQIAREYIVDNIDNLWDVDHIIGKVRQNFGCGDFGSAGYLLYKEEPNFLWNWFSQEGTYYWKYACISTSFFFAVLLILGTGGAVQFFKKTELQESELLLFAVELAFWGLCLFLMLWEAQNKQLYNHSGWMIISLVGSLNLLGEAVGKGRNQEKQREAEKNMLQEQNIA